MCVLAKAGTYTRTAISGTLDTNWHDLRVRWTASNTIACSVDGGTETALATTNYPTTSTAMTPQVYIDNNATANAVLFTIDYVWHAVTAGVTR
jgi:hypothetical protein